MQKASYVTNYLMHFSAMHALLDCDTTSRVCRTGKTIILNKFKENINFRRLVKTLLYSDQWKQYILAVKKKLRLILILDELHYSKHNKILASVKKPCP